MHQHPFCRQRGWGIGASAVDEYDRSVEDPGGEEGQSAALASGAARDGVAQSTPVALDSTVSCFMHRLGSKPRHLGMQKSIEIFFEV